ncbi:MAG: exodeoxyribonuclease VII large subunit [Planctomycetes bacterium]|nr:exodeoxyribonuclease VII large subunit [Planctomycetota bacterium]
MAKAKPKSVTQLTREIKNLVEGQIGVQWVAGEISNCRPARSGHVYFTLKDEHAQIAAVVWRLTAERLKFQLKDGMEVVAMGPVEVYAARGNYQLIVEQLVPKGVGALETALRQLKEKLEKEGLFDRDRKRPIPRIPQRIALITSPTGAAVKDMLQVITRRWPAASVLLMPVKVQGEGAAAEIAYALRNVQRIPDVDVVVTGRGGGSLEDLWAFNEEPVARAIAECPIPVVSAVGHEIDVSIADLVADVRALTPSEAGELVVPSCDELSAELMSVQNRLVAGLRRKADHARLQLDALASRRAMTNPQQMVRQLAEQLDELADRISSAAKRRLENERHQLARQVGQLEALSPLGVLSRGYSMTFRAAEGDASDPTAIRQSLLREAGEAAPGDRMLTYLNQGQIVSRVESVVPPESAASPADSETTGGDA